MKISFAAPRLPRSGALAVGVHDGGELAATAAEADEATGGALSRAIGSSRFGGKSNQTLVLNAPPGVAASRVVLVGLGKAGDFDARAAQSVGGTIVSTLEKSGDTAATIGGGRGRRGADPGRRDGGQCRLRRVAARLSVRQVPHQGKTGRQAEPQPDHGRHPGACPGAERIPAARRGRGRRFPHPRSGFRAGQRDFPRKPRGTRQVPDGARDHGRSPRRKADGEARDGGAARRGAGQRQRSAAGDDALERRAESQGQEAGRLRRQGRDVRYRRHLHQALRRDGRHEVGHGRRRCRHRAHARARRSQGQGQRGGHDRARREHAVGDRPAARRRGDLDVRSDGRGDQHRRRRTPRAVAMRSGTARRNTVRGRSSTWRR